MQKAQENAQRVQGKNTADKNRPPQNAPQKNAQQKENPDAAKQRQESQTKNSDKRH